jgi:hypothetical protein
MGHRSIRRCATALAAMLVLTAGGAACDNSSADSHPSPTSAATNGSRSGVANSTSATAAGSSPSTSVSVLLADRDNGKTVAVRVGQRLVVTLSSSYWTFDEPSSAVLALIEHHTPATPASCAPGSGCGGTEASFAARAAGAASITAHRTVCGEALQCGADQRTFTVRVTVTP